MCSSSQCAHIRSHHRNADAEILITTGDGKFYSNGLDLNWLGKFVGDKTKAQYFMSHYIRSLFQRIATFPMPTIAAVNGSWSTFSNFSFIAVDDSQLQLNF